METLPKPRSAPARRCRDRELVRFIGRHGAVSIEHVMAALGTGQTMAYRRVASCAERGLVERLALLRDEPTLLRATRDGLRYAGQPRLHRPDLVLLGGERPTAIEVELTPKGPRRLEQILRAWRRASWVAEVRYLCAPGETRRAVERAIRKTRAEGRVLTEEVVPR